MQGYCSNSPTYGPCFLKKVEAGPIGVSQNFLLFFTTEPGDSHIIQATVWKLILDLIWKSTGQTH